MSTQPNRSSRSSELLFSDPFAGTLGPPDSQPNPSQSDASVPEQNEDTTNAQRSGEQNQQNASNQPWQDPRDGSTASDGTGGGDTTDGTGGSGGGDTAGGTGGGSGGLLNTDAIGGGGTGGIGGTGGLLGNGNIGQGLGLDNILGDGSLGGLANAANLGNVIDGLLDTADTGVIRPVINTLNGLLDGDVTNTTLGGGGLIAGTPLAGDGGFANVNVLRADDSSQADLAQVGVGSDLTQALVNGTAGGGGLLAGTPLQSDGALISANAMSEDNSSSSDLAQAGIGTDLSGSLINVDAASDRSVSESNHIVGTDVGPQSGDSGVVADALSDRNSSGSLVDADAGQHQGPSLIDANVATAADQFQFPGLDGVGIDALAGEVGETVGSIDDGAADATPLSAGVDGSVLLQVDASGQAATGDTSVDDGLHIMANTPLQGSLLGA